MACSAAPFGLRSTGHCFHRAHAQQQPPGSNPRWMKSGGQVNTNKLMPIVDVDKIEERTLNET